LTAARGDLDVLPHLERAVEQRAGDHGAEARAGEHAVHGQMGPPAIGVRPCGVQGGVQGGAQLVEAHTGPGGAGDELRPLQAGAGKGGAYVFTHQLQPLVVDEVALGERDDAAGDAEQVQDVEVLVRLRHHSFVGGHDEQGHVDAPRAGQHVADEALVPGHVHHGGLAPGGQAQPGKAQLDGHATPLLLGQAIGVDAGQGVDECALAVVDVPGSTDDV